MYARFVMQAIAIVGVAMAAGTVQAATVTTLDLPAGASASVIYDVADGPDVRFDVSAGDTDISETHETDVLFGFDYGSVHSANGVRFSWCNGKRKGDAPVNAFQLFGLRSVDGPNLLVLGNTSGHDFQRETGDLISVENGVVVEAPFLHVVDASLLEDVSQIMDSAWVASLPNYSGPAIFQALGTMVVSVSDPNLSGDFDGDGDVDGRDFLNWQRDPDHDINALANWRANYGSGGQADASGTAVPEPSTALLVLAVAVPLCMHSARSTKPRSKGVLVVAAKRES